MLFIINSELNTELNINLYNLLKNNNDISHTLLNKFNLLLDEQIRISKKNKTILKLNRKYN